MPVNVVVIAIDVSVENLGSSPAAKKLSTTLPIRVLKNYLRNYFIKGEIVVTDTDNKAVKVISAGGQQISKLEGEFTCPVGVAVDSNDNIIVSDWNDKISVSIFMKYS